MYQHAYGVRLDYEEAVKWVRRAAEQGDVGSQLVLAGLYFDGLGVRQDYVMGLMWFNIAASQGSEAATESRDMVAKHMTREQIAEAQKLAREWKPKE